MDRLTRTAFLKQVSNEGYAEKLGLRLVDLQEGHATVEMIPKEEDTNIFGMVHGGAIFSLIDEAFQLSCNSHGKIAVALSMNVVYHCPATSGKRLRAVSNEVHRSKKTGTYDIKVTDASGTLIASCQALAYRRRDEIPFLKKEGS